MSNTSATLALVTTGTVSLALYFYWQWCAAYRRARYWQNAYDSLRLSVQKNAALNHKLSAMVEKYRKERAELEVVTFGDFKNRKIEDFIEHLRREPRY